MKADPEKQRAWQRRGAERYAAKLRERKLASPRESQTKPAKQSTRRAPRRNDGPWRNECIERYGDWCRACGARGTQMDHMKPRSQGGPSVVENGLPLCPSCHEQKTNARLRIEYTWLDSEQVAWLAAVGWVAWDDDGQPYGEGWKHFAPRRTRPDDRRSGGHG